MLFGQHLAEEHSYQGAGENDDKDKEADGERAHAEAVIPPI
jgi:hypothetical protein